MVDGSAHVHAQHGSANDASPIAPERDAVEVMARRLCAAAGWREDIMGYLDNPYEIPTPRGIFREFGPSAPIPHWHCYALMARELLAPTSARSAAPELDSEGASTP